MTWRWYRTPALRQCGHALQYWPLRICVGVLGRLPPRVVRPICAGCAVVARRAWPGRARRAYESLRIAFPERSQRECRAIVHATYRHFAELGADVARARRRIGGLCEMTRAVGAIAVLRDVASAGRGGVIVTGHFGNWELAAAILGRAGFDVAVVSRRYRNPLIQCAMERLRQEFGVAVLYTDGGLAPMRRAVRRGTFVAFVADKRLKRARIPAEFFGRPVLVPAGPALLAVTTGAPLIFGAAVKCADRRLELVVGSPTVPQRSGGRAEIARLTQAHVSGLEAAIRRAPEQWIWFHDRWRAAARAAR